MIALYFVRYHNCIMAMEEKSSLLEMHKKVYEVKCHKYFGKKLREANLTKC